MVKLLSKSACILFFLFLSFYIISFPHNLVADSPNPADTMSCRRTSSSLDRTDFRIV